MLRRILRKMICNKQMILCLLIGLVLAVAMVSSVPMYTNGVLQRMLIKDLENYQINTGHFPGTYVVDQKLYNLEKSDATKNFKYFDDKITNELFPELGVPALAYNCNVINDFLSMVPEDRKDDKKGTKNLRIEGLKGIQEHVTIKFGEMPSNKKVDGVYQVMVSEEAVKKLDLTLGNVYLVTSILNEEAAPIKIKVVGIFINKTNKDPYWKDGYNQLQETAVLDYDLFNEEYMTEDLAFLTEVIWYYALDYHKILINELKTLTETIEWQGKYLRMGNAADGLVPSISILDQYTEREKQLKTTLWVFQMPILIMIIFYLFMVSQLIIEQEKNEIAVLKSRGASIRQIIKTYFLQGIILSVIALILGPLAGLGLCKLLGASNGFLQFINRTKLSLHLNLDAYIYSLIAVVIFIITMLFPAYLATRTTIVAHKQKKSRKGRKPIWERYFIDILILAISLYGLYSYKNRQDILKITGIKGSEIPMDPLLFLISTLFIFGMGMCFLRVFPYIVKLIYFLGKKVWGPVAYSSLLNVSRGSGRDQFIMIFLILTIAIGVYNANASRTINTNSEEKVKYSIGADVVLNSDWENDAESAAMGMGPESEGNSVGNKKVITYVEPSFVPYEKMDVAEQVTKVFAKQNAIATVASKNVSNVYVMGIESKAFGETAWFRNKLLSNHINEYLNVMAKDPRAFIVSTSFKKKYNVKIGESVYIKWGENDYLEGIIYGFVDYWPSYNPYYGQIGDNQQSLVVANLSYINAKTKLEPYQVWVKQKPGTTTKQIYDYIQNNKLKILTIKNTSQDIIVKKNDPMLQGTNGALTMGFMVTMIICTIGFLIYWILSIQRRTLQFGILRAMGLKLKDVIGMLLCEQLLVSGTAILVGILVGGIASKLYVPLLQIVYGTADQIPPFRVSAVKEDYLQIYLIIFIMLLFGIGILGRLISKININQAIKLGED